MKPSFRIATAIFALAVFAVVSGCTREGPEDWVVVGPPPVSEQGDVSLYRDVLFADIPMPEGYQLDRHASHSFQGSMFRQGVFHFYGRLHWLDALHFYRASLPAAGWTLDKTERGFDFRILHFRKGPEKLIVVVRQSMDGSRTEMQLDNVGKNDLLLRGKLPGE